MENNNQIQQNQIDQILAEAGLTWPIENAYSTTNQKPTESNLNWNSNNDTPTTYQSTQSYISHQPTQQTTQPDNQSPMPISVIRSLTDINVSKDMSQYLIPPSPGSSPAPPLPEKLPHERAVETIPVEAEDYIEDDVTESFEEMAEEVIIEDTDQTMTEEVTPEGVTPEEATPEEDTTEEATPEEDTTEGVTENFVENSESAEIEQTGTEEVSEEMEGDFLEEANSSLDSSLPGEVQCEFCGNSFPSNDLPAHQESILTEDGSPAFKCQICSLGFDKKCVSELHQSSCVPRSSLEEIEDRVSSSEDERKTSEEHQPEEENEVNIPISFATEVGLQNHRLNKDGSDWLLNGFLSFQCDLCGDRFKDEADMNKERFKEILTKTRI